MVTSVARHRLRPTCGPRAYRKHMKLTDNDWEVLQPHVNTPHRNAPRAVYATLVALVSTSDIVASWAACDTETDQEATTWSHWIITKDLVARSELKFAARYYDLTEEDDALGGRPAPVEVLQAWTRRLDSAAKFAFTHVGILNQSSPGWYGISGVTLTLDDGFTLEVPFNQTRIHDANERTRSDEFIAALRSFV